VEPAISVTKTVYTVSDFVQWQKADALNLRPYFQRGSVWSAKSKSYLIDTLIRGFPIPIIYLQVKTDRQSLRSIRQVVDGQQRLRTILAYVAPSSLEDRDDSDNFAIMRTHNRDLAGRAFNDLPEELKDRLLNTEISVHILPGTLSDPSLLQLFARLNSTGVRLNDQEQRNAAYHGEFKTLAYRLSYEQIDRWNEWKAFNRQALAQMREVEFVSDLIMMMVRGPGAKTKAGIDNFYRVNDDNFPFADQVSDALPRVFDDVSAVLAAGPRGGDLNSFSTQSWLYTISTLIAASRYGAPFRAGEGDAISVPTFSNADLRRALFRARQALDEGDVPRVVAEALRGASTDASSRETRLTFILRQLER